MDKNYYALLIILIDLKLVCSDYYEFYDEDNYNNFTGNRQLYDYVGDDVGRNVDENNRYGNIGEENGNNNVERGYDIEENSPVNNNNRVENGIDNYFENNYKNFPETRKVSHVNLPSPFGEKYFLRSQSRSNRLFSERPKNYFSFERERGSIKKRTSASDERKVTVSSYEKQSTSSDESQDSIYLEQANARLIKKAKNRNTKKPKDQKNQTGSNKVKIVHGNPIMYADDGVTYDELHRSNQPRIKYVPQYVDPNYMYEYSDSDHFKKILANGKIGFNNGPKFHVLANAILNYTTARDPISPSLVTKMQALVIQTLDYFTTSPAMYVRINKMVNAFMFITKGQIRGLMPKEFYSMIHEILWPEAVVIKPLLFTAKLMQLIIILCKVVIRRQDLTKKDKFDLLISIFIQNLLQ